MSKDRSPWLELHVSAASHQKTWKLATALGVDRVTAFGHICCLWLWALEQAQDGDLSGFSDEAIADAAGWKKKAHRFIDALQASGYVDQDLRIHEHQLYVGKLMERRERDRVRIANRRAEVRGQSTGSSDGHTEGQSRDSRAGVARHSQQSTVNSQQPTEAAAAAGAGAREEEPPPNAFRAVEDLLGSLTKPVIDAIDAELDGNTPEIWIVEAAKEAAINNGRSWKYVTAILDRWSREGFKAERQNHAAIKRGTTGRRADFEVAGAGAGPDF